MAKASGDTQLEGRMRVLSTKLKTSADRLLWNESLGVFMATTGIEHDRIDLWANAMAGASGFASPTQSDAIFDFFQQHEHEIFFEGQVRQIPSFQQWAVAAGHDPVGHTALDAAGATVVHYQNGGYW
jgi:hypothetical protein